MQDKKNIETYKIKKVYGQQIPEIYNDESANHKL